MTTVKAIGFLNDKKLNIVCSGENNSPIITCNGKKDNHIVTLLNMAIKIAPPIANNFYYTEPSISAYYHVLNTVFFDHLESIIVKGEIEPIPWEEGLIY